MNRFKLLVTKKISPALVLKAGLKSVDILEKEFIQIHRVTGKQIEADIKQLRSENSTVVFTSKNAVAAVADKNLPAKVSWKIFCIEGATKDEVVKHFGEETIAGTARNASELAKVILNDALIGKVVFVCGEKRLNTLPDTLRKNGVEVSELIVYTTENSPQKVIDDFDAIAFFSPTAVKSFFSENTLNEKIFCLSVGQTTTDAIKLYTTNEVFTAETPSEDIIINMAIKLSNKNYY